jgi:hypothetical protein
MRMPRWSRRSAFASAVLIALAAVPPAHAVLRSPQIPVSGTALTSFFASQFQAINVVGSQLDAQRFNVPAGGSVQVIPFGAPGANVGIYNALAPSPALYPVYPGAASPGWNAVATFRSTPDRVVVNLFDALNALQGTNTFLGADRTDFGFYSQFSASTWYSEDARNPAARAQMLAYNGTGSHTGSLWFVFEATAAAGGDFADAIFLVTMASAPVPVTPSSWSRMKTLYR